MIFFDLDGTLIDSNGIWVDIDLAFLGRHGLEPTPEYAHTVGHSIFPTAAQFTRDYYGLDMTPQAIMDEWMAGARGAYAGVALKPGAAAFLDRCRASGEPMAILTACVPELCRTALDRHGLTPYFQQVLFAQEMGLEKRNPQAFLQAAELMGVEPGGCTLYEDAPANCASAKSVGMTVVGVYDPFYEAYQDQVKAGSHRYIKSFLELLD